MLFLEGRIDGKKSDFLTTGLSTDGQSAFFMRIDLKGVLAAKQVIVGVYEYMGGQVVIRFDDQIRLQSWRNAERTEC